MAANPNNYPPKTALFLNLQRTSGLRHEKYRTDGNSAINVTDPAQAAAIVARTQPVAGAGAFQQGPAPGSAAARELLAASIANRGTVANRTGIYDESYRGPTTIAAFDRGFAGGALNVPIIRNRLASNNLSFVKQLGWVSGLEQIHACICTPVHRPQDRLTSYEARLDALDPCLDVG